jgi:FAD/FMN-containing dehydrogenase
MLSSDKVLRRGQDGYEEARCVPAGHARIPDRFPELIVRAEDESDVAAALRIAASEDLKVAVRSGGHSFAMDSLRDGSLLVDVGGVDEVHVDAEARTATVGPGRKCFDLLTLLSDEDLFFPVGHCKGVGLGGYLLQGGWGWNSRALGVACESVIAVDVVPAEGVVVRADADHEPDLYWAARGAGPGFFGVATRFHLRVHPKPREFGSVNALYPIELLDEVYTWAREVCPEVDRRVEVQLLMGSIFEPLGVTGPCVALAAGVFAGSEEEARAAIAITDTCPANDRAIMSTGYFSANVGDAADMVMLFFPETARRCVDNMWTSAPAADLLPGLHAIAETMPPPPSYLLWLDWEARDDPPDILPCSIESDIYMALYGGWTDAADDDRYEDWAASRMREMEPLAAGIQLADEGLGRRPARFATDEAMARLDVARSTYDPAGRFHSWGGRL